MNRLGARLVWQTYPLITKCLFPLSEDWKFQTDTLPGKTYTANCSANDGPSTSSDDVGNTRATATDLTAMPRSPPRDGPSSKVDRTS